MEFIFYFLIKKSVLRVKIFLRQYVQVKQDRTCVLDGRGYVKEEKGHTTTTT